MYTKYELDQFADLKTEYENYKIASVPSKEIFNYVFEKAKDGNEMAVTQILEWASCCIPKNDIEKQVYNCIIYALKLLFK